MYNTITHLFMSLVRDSACQTMKNIDVKLGLPNSHGNVINLKNVKLTEKKQIGVVGIIENKLSLHPS